MIKNLYNSGSLYPPAIYNDAYTLYKTRFKYFIVPSTGFPLNILPFPNNFVSFYFKYNADITLKAMNAAFREGYRVNSFFGGSDA